MAAFVQTKQKRFVKVNLHHRQLKCLDLFEIKENGVLDGFVQGEVDKAYPVFPQPKFGKVRKLVLKQTKGPDTCSSNDRFEISLFLQGDAAQKCEEIKQGDVVVIEKPFIEPGNPKSHLVGNKDKSDIWIWVVTKKGYSKCLFPDQDSDSDFTEEEEKNTEEEEDSDPTTATPPQPTRQRMGSVTLGPKVVSDAPRDDSVLMNPVVLLTPVEKASTSSSPRKTVGLKKCVVMLEEIRKPVKKASSSPSPPKSMGLQKCVVMLDDCKRYIKSSSSQGLDIPPTPISTISPRRRRQPDANEESVSPAKKPAAGTSTVREQHTPELQENGSTSQQSTPSGRILLSTDSPPQPQQQLQKQPHTPDRRKRNSEKEQQQLQTPDQRECSSGTPTLDRQQNSSGKEQKQPQTPNQRKCSSRTQTPERQKRGSVKNQKQPHTPDRRKRNSEKEQKQLQTPDRQKLGSGKEQKQPQTPKGRKRSSEKDQSLTPSGMFVDSSDSPCVTPKKMTPLQVVIDRVSVLAIDDRNLQNTPNRNKDTQSGKTPSGFESPPRISRSATINLRKETGRAKEPDREDTARMHEDLSSITIQDLPDLLSDQRSDQNQPGPSSSGQGSDQNQPGPSTSGQGSDQNQPGPSTSGQGSDQNQPGPSTSGQRSNQNQPGPSTSVQRSDQNQPEPSTSGQGSDQNQPGLSTSGQGPDQNQPAPSTSGQGSNQNQPGPSPSDHGSDQNQPGPSTSGQRYDQNQPGPSTSGQRSDQNQPGPSTSGQRSNQNQPGPSTRGQRSDQNQPGLSTSGQRSDQNQPGPSTSAQGSDQNQPRPSTSDQRSDQNQPGPSTSAQGSDQNQPGPSTGATSQPYTTPPGYTKLSDIQSKLIVNVYGVVKFFKSPWQSRGTDMCSVVVLVDPSTDDTLECVLFQSTASLLPQIHSIRDIVRLHRVKIAMYKDRYQGKSSRGFAAVVFGRNPKEAPSKETARVSTGSFTFTDADKKFVEKLKEWSVTRPDLFGETLQVTVADIKRDMNFHITCVVTGIAKHRTIDCVVLTIADGTAPRFSIYSPDEDNYDILVPVTRYPSVPISVYGIHAASVRHLDLQDGSVVLLHNVRAAAFQDGPGASLYDSVNPTLELCLHRGTDYGRGITLLKSDAPEAKAVMDRLA